MKFQIIALLVFGLTVLSSVSHAAPEKWEYAVLKEEAYNNKESGAKLATGVLLRLPKSKTVFMPYPTFEMSTSTETKESFLLDILNRLGGKGWELMAVPGYREERRYVLKRRK